MKDIKDYLHLYLGCEIDKDYFEAQEKRFKEAINEPLFQTQPERIQAKLL